MPRFDPPIAFAHRGARAHAPENTLESFRLAARLGATGMESDVWLTSDGEVVMDHDGVVKSLLRTKLIAELPRRSLPSHIPTLAEYYEALGTAFPLSLDVKDPRAFGPTAAVARSFGDEAVANLWLCSPNLEPLIELRRQVPDVKLVDSTRIKRITEGPERRAATLRNAGVDAINMHHTDWSLGLTTLFHRFDLYTFGWDAQHERILTELANMEIDAVYCDNVETMMSVIPGGTA